MWQIESQLCTARAGWRWRCGWAQVPPTAPHGPLSLCIRSTEGLAGPGCGHHAPGQRQGPAFSPVHASRPARGAGPSLPSTSVRGHGPLSWPGKQGDDCSRPGLPCPAPAWVASAHVAPAQDSWLCSRRPPDVSQGDAARSATRRCKVQARAGVQLQGAGETIRFLNQVSAPQARPQRGTSSAEGWLFQQAGGWPRPLDFGAPLSFGPGCRKP